MSTAKIRLSILVSLEKTLQKLPRRMEQAGIRRWNQQLVYPEAENPAEAGFPWP
jgi:hypothetical protein